MPALPLRWEWDGKKESHSDAFYVRRRHGREYFLIFSIGFLLSKLLCAIRKVATYVGTCFHRPISLLVENDRGYQTCFCKSIM